MPINPSDTVAVTLAALDVRLQALEAGGEPQLPGAISDLEAVALSPTSVLLTWTAANGATSHQYRVDGGTWTATSTADEHTVTGLTAETDFDFEVRGVNDTGAGEASNIATVTTQAEPSEPAEYLDAPVLLALATGPTTSPPKLEYVLPHAQAQEGDTLRLVAFAASSLASPPDPASATPAVTVTRVLTDDAAADAAALDAGIAALSGPHWFYARLERGAEAGRWSNIVLHGTAAAPTLLSSGFSKLSDIPLAETLSFSQPVEAFIIGEDGNKLEIMPLKPDGTVASSAEAQFYIPAANWQIRWLNNGAQAFTPAADFDADNIYKCAFDVTGANEVGAAALPLSITLTEADATPDTLDFADVTGATPGQIYSSDAVITLSGLEPGFTFLMTVTAQGDGGTFSLDGEPGYAPGTYEVQNGTVISDPVVEAPTVNLSTNGLIFTCGSATGSYLVSTPSGAIPFLSRWEFVVDASDTAKLYQALTQTGANATALNDPVGFIDDASTNGFDFAAAANGNRPLFKPGAAASLVFDGTDDYLSRNADLGMRAAGSCCIVIGIKAALTGGSGATVLGMGSNPGSGARYRVCAAGEDHELQVEVRNDAGVYARLSATNASQGGAYAPAPFDGEYRVIVINDTGTGVQVYVDGRKHGLVADTTARSLPATFNRTAIMGWVRTSVTNFAPGELQFLGVLNGENLADGGAVPGGYATPASEVGLITSYVAAKQGRTL